MEIRYAEEPDARGTAGAIRFAEDMLGDRFLVLNGDVLCELDLTALIEQHERTGRGRQSPSTRSTTRAATGSSIGAKDGEITEFLEKPKPEQIDTDEINAGAYLLERSVLERIPPDRAVSIEREVFPRADRRRASTGSGSRATGSTSEHRTASSRRTGTSSRAVSQTVVDANRSTRKASLIGEGCEIAADAEIRAPSVIGRDSQDPGRRADRPIGAPRRLCG